MEKEDQSTVYKNKHNENIYAAPYTNRIKGWHIWDVSQFTQLGTLQVTSK